MNVSCALAAIYERPASFRLSIRIAYWTIWPMVEARYHCRIDVLNGVVNNKMWIYDFKWPDLPQLLDIDDLVKIDLTLAKIIGLCYTISNQSFLIKNITHLFTSAEISLSMPLAEMHFRKPTAQSVHSQNDVIQCVFGLHITGWRLAMILHRLTLHYTS